MLSGGRGSSKHVSSELNAKKSMRGREGGGFGGGWDVLKLCCGVGVESVP